MHWLKLMGDDPRALEILTAPERTFGRSLRRMREQLGWSQRELARRLLAETGESMDPSAITRIEAGQRSVSLGQALRIAYTVGVEALDMLLDEPSEPVAPDEHLADMRRRRADQAARLDSARTALEQAEADVSVRQAVLRTMDEQIEALAASLASRGDDPAAT